MHPIRRLKQNLRHQRSTDHDCAGQKHDEHGGTIAGIGKTIIESAALAARLQFQESGKQPPLTAARAGTGQARRNGAGERGDRLGHSTNLSFRSSPRKRGTQLISTETGFPLYACARCALASRARLFSAKLTSRRASAGEARSADSKPAEARKASIGGAGMSGTKASRLSLPVGRRPRHKCRRTETARRRRRSASTKPRIQIRDAVSA